MKLRYVLKLRREITARLWRFTYRQCCAINIETGVFEVADTSMAAVDRIYEREPDAQPWVIRIGHRAVFRFGSRSPRKPV
jgi:hypothetical protein